ncbi:hypothetical protein [Rhodohalobacter sp. 8-1]|uniref:hypothetical protein n=1 Tax=Rhodohalobacter sp. 8-1 TaxID=3131972 RepID=UPI0030EB4DF8
MPSQTVWMIRLSLSYLLIAILIGALLLVHKAIPIHNAIWGLLPIHYEMAIWGWLVQFVMGTAYWMFPRHLKDKGRGSPALAWCVVAAMNLGLWVLLGSHLTGDYMAAAGRGLLLIGVLLFAGLMWNRVVSYRNRK